MNPKTVNKPDKIKPIKAIHLATLRTLIGILGNIGSVIPDHPQYVTAPKSSVRIKAVQNILPTFNTISFSLWMTSAS